MTSHQMTACRDGGWLISAAMAWNRGIEIEGSDIGSSLMVLRDGGGWLFGSVGQMTAVGDGG